MSRDGFIEATRLNGNKIYFRAGAIELIYATARGSSICAGGDDYAVAETVTELLAQLDVVYCAECGKKMEAGKGEGSG